VPPALVVKTSHGHCRCKSTPIRPRGHTGRVVVEPIARRLALPPATSGDYCCAAAGGQEHVLISAGLVSDERRAQGREQCQRRSCITQLVYAPAASLMKAKQQQAVVHFCCAAGEAWPPHCCELRSHASNHHDGSAASLKTHERKAPRKEVPMRVKGTGPRSEGGLTWRIVSDVCRRIEFARHEVAQNRQNTKQLCSRYTESMHACWLLCAYLGTHPLHGASLAVPVDLAIPAQV